MPALSCAPAATDPTATDPAATAPPDSLDAGIDDIGDSAAAAPPSLSALLSALRRSALSPHNRLASIRADAVFVARAAARLRRPLVANERCGSWYVPPGAAAASAYFKSTDGHDGAWRFSCRRLNLHLVGLAEENDGIIIVDSTRRGKRMPDALSATVPVWCAVLNRALLPADPRSAELFLPPHLPPSTRARVLALLPSFAAQLAALGLDLRAARLSKPLRPFWITPDSALPGDDGDGSDDGDGGSVPPIFRDYRPVVCCTASRRLVDAAETDNAGYVQGAADDAEHWALGLTPALFWPHADELLAADDARLPALIARLVSQHRRPPPAAAAADAPSPRRLAPCLSVCALPLAAPAAPAVCHVALADAPTPPDAWPRSASHLEVGLGRHKTASRNLRRALPDICAFAARFLRAADGAADVVVACESGADLSVGAALALSCHLFDDDGRLRVPHEGGPCLTKPLVKARLGAIMAAFPEANPSRQTLQSVNSFLMDWRT